MTDLQVGLIAACSGAAAGVLLLGLIVYVVRWYDNRKDR